MSRIFCVIDGMTDPKFDPGTYRHLSEMQLLREEDTSPNTEAETLNCVLYLLGVRNIPAHLRGYVEALGAGISVKQSDLILRGSWFALDKDGCCTVPCAAPPVIPRTGCLYHPLGEYKCLLIFPDMAQDVDSILTFSPYACAGQKAENLCPKGNDLLRDTFREFLSDDKCLIPWGQSIAAQLPPFPQRAAVISGKSTVKGIARLLGMDLIEVPGATGDVDTDLSAKTDAALSAAEQYPFVLLHINGADEAAHRRDTAQKHAFLSQTDTLVLSKLLASPHEILVASDHGADPETGLHIGGSQPVFTNKI